MNKFLDAIVTNFAFGKQIGFNRYLSILRDAFMLAFPLTMFGSIVVAISNLPFKRWYESALSTCLVMHKMRQCQYDSLCNLGLVTTYLNHKMKMVFLAEHCICKFPFNTFTL